MSTEWKVTLPVDVFVFVTAAETMDDDEAIVNAVNELTALFQGNRVRLHAEVNETAVFDEGRAEAVPSVACLSEAEERAQRIVDNAVAACSLQVTRLVREGRVFYAPPF